VNFYDTLDIKPGATRKEIRDAYRRLAKRWHPDKPSGDAAAFAKIKIAHDVLTDPDRKAHYDATGNYDERRMEGAEEAEKRNFMMNLLLQAIAEIGDPEHTDVIGVAKRKLADAKKQALAGQKPLTDAVERLEKIKAKITRKEGPNYLALGLQSQIDAYKQQLAKLEQTVASMTEVAEMLDGYEYEYESQTAEPMYRSGLGGIGGFFNERAL
jgi:curved DNA-binding protein CbpA